MFLSMSDKSRLDNIKIFTGTPSTSFSESFHYTRTGKCQQGRGNTLRHQFIKRAKVSRVNLKSKTEDARS